MGYRFLVILAMLLFADSARCADADHERLDEESLRSYMAGEYDLIGRKPDSTATDNGHVTFRDENGVLQVTRTIDGKTDKCVAQIDTVAGGDRIPVLKFIFISTARSTMPHTAGNLIPTITRASPATFTLPAPNRLDSKRFFQSTNDASSFPVLGPAGQNVRRYRWLSPGVTECGLVEVTSSTRAVRTVRHTIRTKLIYTPTLAANCYEISCAESPMG